MRPQNVFNLSSKTLGENIADNGGLKVAFRAFKRSGSGETLPGINYSPDQLFFISLGQKWCTKFTDDKLKNYILTYYHAPSETRVNLMVRNLPEFSEAFNCKRSNQEVCSIW